MTTRTATCRCGHLKATYRGEPVRVSVCHCLNCQKRSGSAFAAQARWDNANVTVEGAAKDWVHTGESGHRATFRFCPDCGSTVCYTAEAMPGLTAVAVGAFADPAFPAPHYSVYETRKHAWVTIAGDGIDHMD